MQMAHYLPEESWADEFGNRPDVDAESYFILLEN